MFWQYRPRDGYPSVPRWLMIVILIVGAVAYMAVVGLAAQDPTGGPAGP